MPDPIAIPGGTIVAKCSSMTIVDSESEEVFYINYNHQKKQIYAQRAKNGKIDEVYREGEKLYDVNWVLFLMRAHSIFSHNRLYNMYAKNNIGVVH